MARIVQKDKRFGDIAIDMQLVSKEKIDRALVVQELILTRTKVHMTIGKVLKEMGALNQEQIDTILAAQNYVSADGDNGEADCQCELTEADDKAETPTKGLALTISKDKLSAFISPNGQQPEGLTLDVLKDQFKARSVVHGLVEDEVLERYLAQDKLPLEPFRVATGTAATPGKPPEIIYHFDTDPLKIGTLKDDGTMDWKDRGEIPQVKPGDILVVKTKGEPGQTGTTVCGKALPPPRMRNPKLKSGKGTQRSEDGLSILAKVDGSPKLSSDGKVFVFNMLNIDGDIGVETGHIDYDGQVEASGGVNSGYTVKAMGLRTAAIQDATIEVEEDLVCHGGMYGSKITVGGSLKASHIHNCTIEVLGELVVEKEVYESTIETNGRCLIVEGKLIDSRIDAKKGVYAKDIGSEGSTPCELTVGYDRKYERDMAGYKAEKDELKRQKKSAQASHPELNDQVAAINEELGALAQEQDNFMVQKQQFEEQLAGEGPNPVDPDDEEERLMLEDMIHELVQKNEEFDTRVRALMSKEDNSKMQLEAVDKRLKILEDHIEKLDEKMEILKDSKKVDPGIPEVKAGGTIFNRTEIIGPHKEMTLPQDMRGVRIAESKVDPDGNRYQIKISNL